VLGAFLFMRLIGMPSDIMSLGGIAIAIGVMVDAGIVMTENIYRRLSESGREPSGKERLDTLISAAGEVGPPIFFAILIIIVAFVPVFSLTGQSGKLFRPLAFTKTFVMAVSAVLSITLLPVLSSLFLRGGFDRRGRNRLANLMKSLYRPAAVWAMRRRLLVVILAAASVLAGMLLFVAIPSEFMPPLDEGDLLFMPVLLPGASLSQVKEIMRIQDIVITSLPEVETAVGKLGRAETATDPAPVAMIETVIKLKPKKEWRSGMTREKLIEEIKEKTRMPGVSPIMTQPIRNRIDMLATGIQTPVGIKVFGSDLAEIERIAVQIEGVVRGIHGTRGSYAERLGNKPYLEIEVDRERAARYGVLVGNIQKVIATAVGGMNIMNTVEGRERYPIRVRYPREMRDDEREIGNILVPTPSGAQIPLSLVASIRREPGPAMIATENTLPYVRVFTSIDTEGVGLMEFVEELEGALEREIKPFLPRGVYYSIAGQYEYKREADRRLIILVPICLFIIFLLLYTKLRSFSSALVLITALPFSFAGAVLLQFILGINFSVAVWVGYIALFGVAVEDGIVILDYMQSRIAGEVDLRGSAIEAAAIRVRPILMTTATTVLALLPIMFATGTGSEVMRPIATPTVGGMITCTLSNLFIVPVLFVWIEERRRVN
ncbi:MAG TPA: efflux RND transporter permease subunit, partial [Candidatus Eisenbacteria bacterium]|nr:efflux RND transporter permease subunit [Candidatus Eisenbacteria bacterium]